MGRAKEIIVKVIPSKIANEFVKKHHYSGKVVNNSVLHFGCFLDDKLHGVLSYGNSIDKSKMVELVNTGDKTKNQKWNEFLELNRMAFDDYLPKYSESRCIAISIKLLKKNAPHIKWIVSFADGIQCGDGTIYRASGFYLTQINSKAEMLRMPNGEVRHRIAMHTDSKLVFEMGGKNAGIKDLAKHLNAEIMNGNQFRYIYLIDKNCSLNVPILPFSKIDEMGAGMYKGKKITLQERKVINESDIIDSNFTS
jgi:hypothetical protein